VLFIPKQLGLGLVVRPMKSFAFMQGFFDFVRYFGLEKQLYKRKLVGQLLGGFKSYLKDTSSCLTFS
jgi:hypothetical protein